MKILIVIPARYGSTRLPGKPLLEIANHSMLSRVVYTAKKAITGELKNSVSLLVATDDKRIGTHCQDINVPWVMTSSSCATGTDRVLEAVKQLNEDVDFIINLQGDLPLLPFEFIRNMLQAAITEPKIDFLTPVTPLTWAQLDELRVNKLTTPQSGTTVILDKNNYAIWFSKQIIPAIRNENLLRENADYSPVYRHIGIYGYTKSALEMYASWSEGHYEKLEGLEQLRILENGYKVRCIRVKANTKLAMTGVDSPEDIVRSQKLIETYGDPLGIV